MRPRPPPAAGPPWFVRNRRFNGVKVICDEEDTKANSSAALPSLLGSRTAEGFRAVLAYTGMTGSLYQSQNKIFLAPVILLFSYIAVAE
jgi:hypothetical protein